MVDTQQTQGSVNGRIGWIHAVHPGKPWPYDEQWSSPLAAGASTGAMLFLIMLLLQPFGLRGYDGDWRWLAMTAFALVPPVVSIVWHPVENALYRRRGRRWRLGTELVSLTGLFALTLFPGHLVNQLTLDRWPQSDLSFPAFLEFCYHVALPYGVFLMPFLGLVRYHLSIRKPKDSGTGRRAIVTGENRDERLVLYEAQFLYARAAHNYVELFLLEQGHPKSHLVRSTLSRVARQLPFATRVHRSYIINPTLIQSRKGNARKRVVHLRHIPDPIPLSPRYDRDRR